MPSAHSLIPFLTAIMQQNVGIDLFSRSVAGQVSLAQRSLTSVFGMGTGGPSVSETPTGHTLRRVLCIYGLVHLQGLEPWTH